MNKTDRRYVQTHGKIRQSFEQMILNRDYREITVSSLVEEVGINRKTFYLHYESLDALLDELVQEIAGEIVSYMELHQPMFSEAAIEGYLQMLSQKLPLHRRLICAPEYQFVFHRVCDRVMRQRMEQARGYYAPEGFRLRTATEAVSLIIMQTYRSWLQEDMPISTRELAHLIYRMLSEDLIGMLRHEKSGDAV